MRSLKVLVLIFVGFSVSSASVFAFGINDDRQRIVDEADLIVEGFLYKDTEDGEYKVQEYIGTYDQSVSLKIGSVKQMTFRVQKIYKGMLKDSPLIHIYSYPKISRDRSALEPAKEYILFLKKHPHREGYQILDYGRGKWLVFDYNGIKKVKAWNQSAVLRPEDEYENYSDLIHFLNQK